MTAKNKKIKISLSTAYFGIMGAFIFLKRPCTTNKHTSSWLSCERDRFDIHYLYRLTYFPS